MAEQGFRKIVINGKEYTSIDEMPPEIRKVYERAMTALADENADGVPDLLQGGGAAGVWRATKEIWGLAREAKESGIRSVELPGGAPRPTPAEVPSAPPTLATPPAPMEPAAVGGGSLGKLVVGILIALGVVFALRQLGVIP